VTHVEYDEYDEIIAYDAPSYDDIFWPIQWTESGRPMTYDLWLAWVYNFFLPRGDVA
jgi:hypothetical protein